MKKLSAPCLFALLLGCFSQTTTMTDIDSLFEKNCINGVILETELSKYEFDTSESVILTGFARNCSETDSVFFTVVPTGANYNVKFNLRNFINFDSYDFMDFDLLTAENAAVVKPSMKTIQRKLAPSEKVEVFSFDLKKLQNLPLLRQFSPGQPDPLQIHIHLWEGIHEFTWGIVLGGTVSKPVFFEIK